MARISDTSYSMQGLFAARELASDPRNAVRHLLDPLFASFLDEGYDVAERLRQGGL
jgi:hypothetical protein